LGLAAVLMLVAGCGQSAKSVNPNAAEVSPAGDIPDNQVFVAYRAPGTGFSVKVPEGWGRSTTGGAVTFSDKLNSIRLEEHKASAPPSAASVKGTALPKGAHVSTVDRRSGKAVRITYLAAAKKDPVTGKTRTNAVERYLFFHNGREAVVTLSGPKGADNVDPWKIVTDSLRWVG
jgi:hypothetical protein